MKSASLRLFSATTYTPTTCLRLSTRPCLIKIANRHHQLQQRNVPSNSRYASTQSDNKHKVWLSDVQARLGKCMTHGTSSEETQKAGEILKDITQNWRTYVAGGSAFLTDSKWVGLDRQKVVWGDMDSMNETKPVAEIDGYTAHVNNVTYARWIESSRVGYIRNFGKHHDPQNKAFWDSLVTPKGKGLILKKLQIEYKLPTTYPDTISVYHKVKHVQVRAEGKPITEFDMEVVVLSDRHQRIIARALETNVLFDYQKNEKSPMPEFMQEALKRAKYAQGDEYLRVMARRAEIDQQVIEVEGALDKPEQ